MNDCIIYYWYTHGLPKNIVNNIKKVIDEKDFDSFIIYYNLLNSIKSENGEALVFLPNEADIFDSDELVDEIDITERENFMLITDNDYEHG